MDETSLEQIARIKGKATPFGFDIQLIEPIHRNSYLATEHDGETFILGIKRMWNDKDGYQASVHVIGQPPLTPFSLDTKITRAQPEDIKKSLGLVEHKDQGLFLGKILYSQISAIVNYEKLGRVFITGKSGTGKSYTVGVLIEELMKKQIPLIIIDRHGEYSTLKLLNSSGISENETFFVKDGVDRNYAKNIIEFGDMKFTPNADLGLEYLLAANMKDLISPGNCLIINLRGLDIPVQESYITQFCNRLYRASANLTENIPPHYLFIDEAHLFAGKMKKDSVEILKLSAQEGRKFGHNLVVITQKPQLLDTTIRSQAGTWFIHKLTDTNDVRITYNSAEGLSSEMEEEIQNLGTGEAIFTGDITPFGPLRVNIRQRYTIHGGTGINLNDFVEEQTQIPKSDLVEKLRNLYSPDILVNATDEIISEKKITKSSLFHQLDLLRQENLELKQSNHDLELKIQEFQSVTKSSDKNQTIKLENDEILPEPEEMYDEKMLELMEKRDDLKIKVQELRKKYEKVSTQLQTLQLTVSGIKVENEQLKDELKKETKRADEAVQLAEKAVRVMKQRRK